MVINEIAQLPIRTEYNLPQSMRRDKFLLRIYHKLVKQASQKCLHVELTIASEPAFSSHCTHGTFVSSFHNELFQSSALLFL